MSIEEEDQSSLKELIQRAEHLLEQTKETTRELLNIADKMESDDGVLPKMTAEVEHTDRTVIKIVHPGDDSKE